MFNYLVLFTSRTSLFIVGSSTYAQLLIVICIVAVLSEVVTHKVPFIYFEVRIYTFFLIYIVLSIYTSLDFPFSPFRGNNSIATVSTCKVRWPVVEIKSN